MARHPLDPLSTLLTTLLGAVSIAAPATAQVQVATIGPSKDNTLYEDPTGSLSNGAGSRFLAGCTGQALLRRGLVAFDLAGHVPPCSQIVSVDLVLELVQTASGPTPVTLHRVVRDWGEGSSVASGGQGGGAPAAPGDATWLHTFFPNQRWTRVGGDFAAAASASTSVGAPGTYIWVSTPQLVADVQAWVDDPAQSFGWVLRGDESCAVTTKAFATKEDGMAGRRPRLVVTYRPPGAAATSFGTGCSGSGAAALALSASGNPVVPAPTFAVALSGGPAGAAHQFVFALRRAAPPIPLGGGCSLLLDPSTALVAIAGDAGRRLALPIPNDPALLGLVLVVQGVVVDAVTTLPVTSDGIELKLGR